MLGTVFALCAIVVGTWNGNWFPSGRAEHRAHPEVEEATSRAAAAMLAEGLREIDPEGTNDVILCLNEIRGPKAASNLVARIGRTNLTVAAISGYRRRDRFDPQQDVIATTLPVAVADWSRWRNEKKLTPPRGFAHARIVLSPAVTAEVYAVHLKSNYGATTDEAKAADREKRERAVTQLLELVRPRRGHPKREPVIVAGDFNADPWRKEFASERTFALMEEAGFETVLAALSPEARGTCPSKKWGSSCLDHVFLRGLMPVGTPIIVPNDNLSDHFAVFTQVR